MARVTVEDCLPNRRKPLRARPPDREARAPLMSGARPIVETTRDKSPVLSLREIATGKGCGSIATCATCSAGSSIRRPLRRSFPRRKPDTVGCTARGRRRPVLRPFLAMNAGW